MKISGNTILITGGSGGIGFELAQQFIKLGNTVIITGRNQTKLDQAKIKAPGIHTYNSDVTNPDEIASLYEKVTNDFPNLNILINNAGIMKNGNFYNPQEELKSVTAEISTNLNGPIWMSHQFIPHLKKKSEAAIVNVTSLLGIIPIPLSPVYGATKAGLRSFTMSLRAQLKHTNIKVFDLAPPATETELLEVFDENDAKDIKTMTAEKLVQATIEGMQKDHFEIRPGQTNQVYYLSKFAPGQVFKLLSKSLDRVLKYENSSSR